MNMILEKLYAEIDAAQKSKLVKISSGTEFDLFDKNYVITLVFSESVKIPTVCKIFEHLLHTYSSADLKIKMRTTHKITISRREYRILL